MIHSPVLEDLEKARVRLQKENRFYILGNDICFHIHREAYMVKLFTGQSLLPISLSGHLADVLLRSVSSDFISSVTILREKIFYSFYGLKSFKKL